MSCHVTSSFCCRCWGKKKTEISKFPQPPKKKTRALRRKSASQTHYKRAKDETRRKMKRQSSPPAAGASSSPSSSPLTNKKKITKICHSSCSICLDDDVSENEIAFLDGCVSHEFCYACIKEWTKTSRKKKRKRSDDGDNSFCRLRCPTCRKEYERIRMKTTSELKFLKKKKEKCGERRGETKEAREERRARERANGERKDFSDDEEDDLSGSEMDDANNNDDDEEEYYENDVHDLIAAGEACHIFCREYDVDEDGILLLCDGCERACHPLCAGFEERTTVPEGDFLCPECHRVAMRHANVRVRGNDFQRKYVEFYMNRRVIRANNNNNNNSNNRNNTRGNSAAHAIDLLSSSEDDEYKII